MNENVKIDFECTGGQFKAIVWRIDKDAEGLVANDSGLVVNDSGLVINDTKLVLNEEDLTVKLVVNGKKLTVKVGSNFVCRGNELSEQEGRSKRTDIHPSCWNLEYREEYQEVA